MKGKLFAATALAAAVSASAFAADLPSIKAPLVLPTAAAALDRLLCRFERGRNFGGNSGLTSSAGDILTTSFPRRQALLAL